MENSHKISQQLRILTILLILFLTHTIFTKAQNAVGSVNGALTVNDMGAAVYSMTFDAPNGGRMTPKIGLAYSSQSSGYGLAGYAIDVTGISVITSGGRDMFHNGRVRGANYDEDSNFYLDGKRLILESGEYGKDMSEYTVEGDPYTKVLMTGGFAWYDSDPFFEVTTSDGTVSTYGYGGNSMLRFTQDGTCRIAAWYISKAVNRYGESITYTYSKENMCVRPLTITYGNGSERGLTAEVKFSYSDMAGDNVRTFRILRMQGKNSKLLSSVTTSINNQVHRKYDFTYDETASDKFSRLVSVTESNGNGESLNPTVLTWNTPMASNIECKDVPVRLSDKRLYSYYETGEPNMFAVDMNGDGIGDIIRMCPAVENGQSYTTLRAILSDASTGNNAAWQMSDDMYHFPANLDYRVTGKTSVMDFNGDGLNDIILSYYSVYSHVNQIQCGIIYGGNINTSDSKDAVQLNIRAHLMSAHFLTASLDMNGDGRDELFLLYKDSSSDKAYYGTTIEYSDEYSPESSVVSEIYPANISQMDIDSKPKELLTGDYNGDGLTDLLLVCEEGYYIYYNSGYTATKGLASVFCDANRLHGTELKDCILVDQGDFNGDGLPDLISYDRDTHTSSLYINTGNGSFNKKQVDLQISDDDKDDGLVIKVVDLDNDGKSDILLAGQTSSSWYVSKDTGFELAQRCTYDNKKDAWLGCIVTGDFNGDGRLDVANVGRSLCLNGSGVSASSVHTYSMGNNNANCGKITKLRDGFGNETIVDYVYATNSAVYQKGVSEYPVNSYVLPLNVVYQVRAADCYIRYNYKDLRIHIAGRGILGFASVVKNDIIHGRTEETNVTKWDTSVWLPTKTLVTTRLRETGEQSKQEITSYHAKTRNNNWLSYISDRRVTDFDGNVSSENSYYDVSRGVLMSRTLNNSSGRRYAYYPGWTRIGGTWMPTHVSNMQQYFEDRSTSCSISDIYTYDTVGNVISAVKKSGNLSTDTIHYTYDRWGNVTSETFHGNDETTGYKYYEYDPTGRFIVKTYTVPESTTTTYTYDIFGNVLTETDVTDASNPLTTTHEYDGWGRRTRTVNPDGTETTFRIYWEDDINNIGGWFTQSYGTGIPYESHVYDTQGREIEYYTSRQGCSLAKYMTYNAKGQIAKMETQYGKRKDTETFTYDARGRVLTDTHSSGAGLTYEYGINTVTATDAAGRSVTKEYDAWGNVKKTEDAAQTVEYAYYSNGKAKSITTADGTLTMEYDEFGRRTRLSDPDAGTTLTTYDKTGHVLKETDGRGVTTTYAYDALGRITERRREKPADRYANPSVTTYTYGTSGNSKGRIVKKDCDGKAVTYEYDDLGRVVSESRGIVYNHDGTRDELRKTYTYNSKGQVEAVTYPASHSDKGLTIGYVYDNDGTLRLMLYNNNPSNRLYRNYGNDGLKIQSRSDYLGKITSYFDNDGYLISRDYDHTYYDKNKERRGISDTLTFSWDKTTGNLLSKTIRNQTEWYAYDNLDRLTGVSRDNIGTMSVEYAGNGNIISKSGIGEYTYDEGDKPHAVREVENTDGIIDDREVYTQYDLNGKVASIWDKGYTAYSWYDYGPDDEKWSSWGWSPEDTNMEWDVERVYWGNYERLTKDYHIREYYFLDNDVLIIRDNPYVDIYMPDIWHENIYQMERDNIGNVVAIYDLYHRKVFEAEYDAWGRQTVIKDEIGFNHGFTGHEMLPQFGLIHMDGRVYDPAIGRFLSPDNYVQLPENSQSFNRYSYCLNNPLKYTDPTGQLFGIDDAVFVFAATSMAFSMMNAYYEDKSVWKAAGISLLSSAASYGIGSIFGATGTFGHELLRAGAHGLASGVTSALSGDNFGRGFVSGVVSSGIGSFASGIDMNDGLMLASCAAAGGLTEWALGGDFIDGAMTGLNIGLYNHCLHYDAEVELPEVTVTGKYRPRLDLSAISTTQAYPAGNVRGVGAAGNAFALVAGVVWIYNNRADIEKGITRAYNSISTMATKTMECKPGYVYHLVAESDGLYPNVRGGSVHLNAGDTWKIGETINGQARYTQSYLKSLKVNMEIRSAIMTDKCQLWIEEKRQLIKYALQYGNLPPGNKMFK